MTDPIALSPAELIRRGAAFSRAWRMKEAYADLTAARKKGGRGSIRRALCGQKVKSKKRRIVVDTLDVMLKGQIQPADIQYRDGALPVPKEVRRLSPFIERISADESYQGAATAAAVRKPGF